MSGKKRSNLQSDKINVLLVNPVDGFSLPVNNAKADAPRQTKISDFPPLGLLYLASYLRSALGAGISVKVIDGKLFRAGYVKGGEKCSPKSMEHDYERWLLAEIPAGFSPDIIGISGPYHLFADEFHYTAHFLKKTFSHSVIVGGGPYPTGSYEECMKDENISYVILGEGEARFANLIKYIRGSAGVSELDGVVYRTGDGIVAIPPAGKLDLSALPFPDRSLADIPAYAGFSSERSEAYKHDSMIRTSIYATRGCLNECTYCYSGRMNYFGHGIRFRTVGDTMAEIKECIERYGADEIQILDENAACNRKYIIDLFESFYKEFPDKKLSLYCIDLRYITEDVVRAVCSNRKKVWFTFGIESGSDRVLNDILKRGLTTGGMTKKVGTIRGALSTLDLESCHLQGSIMFGLPGETIGEMKATIDYCRALSLDWYGVFVYMPLPGTPLFKTCLEKGYMKFGREDYSRLSSSEPVLETPDFTKKDVARMARAANYTLNFVRNVNTVKDPDKAIDAFRYVLTAVPDHPFAFYGLAKSYETKNLPKERDKFMDRFSKEIKKSPYKEFEYLVERD